jgi:AcrR family transcriptional regulator
VATSIHAVSDGLMGGTAHYNGARHNGASLRRRSGASAIGGELFPIRRPPARRRDDAPVTIPSVQREEKSERSRRFVLDAALKLFSKYGYRGTSVREIAEKAGVSIGNLYHHFPDKEAIFRTLLDEYREITASAKFPLRRALATGTFPDNLEEIGYAARDAVRQYRSHMTLLFVDMIEFDGSHIREFYRELRNRIEDSDEIVSKLRPGISQTSAVLAAVRLFLNYFQLEILFGVPEPFGKDSAQIVREIAEMLRRGIAREESS